MALWGNTDHAANSAIFAPAQFRKEPNATNRDNLYANTTEGAFIENLTVGQYGVSVNELANTTAGVSHVVVTAPGEGFTARPTVTFTGSNTTPAAGNTISIIDTVTVAVGGTGYLIGDVVEVAGGTPVNDPATLIVLSVSTVNSQDEGDFTGNFVAGEDYQAQDEITLSDGTVIVVDTVDGNGAVTAFTVDSNSVVPLTGNYAVLTQASTDGAGTGFQLTLSDQNQGVAELEIDINAQYTAIPTLNDNQPTGGSGVGLEIDLTLALSGVYITDRGTGYTAAPTVTIGGAGGSGATATAFLNTPARHAVAHVGWNIRTEGTGGRAGRVQWETLVAMNNISGDGPDDQVLPD